MQTLAAFSVRGVTLPRIRNHAQRLRYQKAMDRLRAGFLPPVRRLFLAELQREAAVALSAARDAATTGAVQGLLLSALRRETEGIGAAYRDAYRMVYPVFAERVYDSLQPGKGLRGTGMEQKADGELVSLWTEAAAAYVRQEGARLVRDVAGFTSEEVERIVRVYTAEAIEEGWGVPELVQQLESRLTTLSRTRAERIARTEILRASNAGSRAGAVSTGLDLVKEWLSALGDRTRDSHAATNGQRRPLAEPYDVGGYPALYPLDPSLPASESIACRCTETYVPA
jgi:hypothetical protein